MKNLITLAVVSALTAATAPAQAGYVVTSGSAASAAGLVAVRDTFVAGIAGARREINWDGVPAAFAAPNNLPADFFNVNSARGVVLSTPGSALQVSANTGLATAVRFGDFNPAYPGMFQAFSEQRLFSAIGSPIVDVHFFVAGTPTPGYTTAFGVIFSDVDLAGETTIAFYDGDTLLDTFAAPVRDNGLSFLGVRYLSGERITRARITSGNSALGPSEGAGADVVVMDDFLYAEVASRALPEPSPLLLLGATLLALRLARRRR